jgi:hypothetical protein
LNLHTLRYRNLNPARLPFRHPRVDPEAQGEGFVPANPPCQDRGRRAMFRPSCGDAMIEGFSTLVKGWRPDGESFACP